MKKIPPAPEIKGSIDTAKHYASMERYMNWLKTYYPERYKNLIK